MSLHQEFLAEIENYLTAKSMKASTFGTKVLKDPTFVFELRNGRKVNTGTIERVREFMASFDGGGNRSEKETAQ